MLSLDLIDAILAGSDSLFSHLDGVFELGLGLGVFSLDLSELGADFVFKLLGCVGWLVVQEGLHLSAEVFFVGGRGAVLRFGVG